MNSRILCVFFILIAFCTKLTYSGVILSVLLKILAVDGFFHIGLPLAIGSFLLGSGLGFIPGVLFGGITAITAAEHYFGGEYVPNYLHLDEPDHLFHQDPIPHGHDVVEEEYTFEIEDPPEYFHHHLELDHPEPLPPLPPPLPHSYVDFYQEISDDLVNPIPLEDPKEPPDLPPPPDILHPLGPAGPDHDHPPEVPPIIDSYVDFYQEGHDVPVSKKKSAPAKVNRHRLHPSHPHYYKAGGDGFYVDENYNPIFLTDGSTSLVNQGQIGLASASHNKVKEKPKKKRKKKVKKIKLKPNFGGSHLKALKQNGMSLGKPMLIRFEDGKYPNLYSPKPKVPKKEKKKEQKKSDIFDKMRRYFPWGFTKKNKELGTSRAKLNQRIQLEQIKEPSGSQEQPSMSTAVYSEMRQIREKELEKLQKDYLSRLRRDFGEKDGWKLKDLIPAIPGADPPKAIPTFSTPLALALNTTKIPSSFTPTSIASTLKIAPNQTEIFDLKNITRVKRSHTLKLTKPLNVSEIKRKYSPKKAFPNKIKVNPAYLKKFKSDVHRFFTLVAAFDQNKCLQRVTCEIHSKIRFYPKLSAYEKNILHTFRVIERVLPMPSHQDLSKKDPTISFRIAARFGLRSKNPKMCQKAYSSCKSNSKTIIQLGNKLQEEGLTRKTLFT